MCKKPDLKKQSDPLDTFKAVIHCGSRPSMTAVYTSHYDLQGFFRAVAATYVDIISSKFPLKISFFEDYDEWRFTLSHACLSDNVFRIDMSNSHLHSFCQYVIGDPINYDIESVIIGCIRDELTKAKGYAFSSHKEEIHTIKLAESS
jgi:hypothetical protein